MSHEIRTPLNGIVGTAEVMRAEVSDPHTREMVETICMASQSLQTVIDDVLDLSKVEAGQLRLQALPFSPRHLVREVWTLFAANARERGVSLTVDVDPDAGREVMADASRLRQVLSNLVGNALKFTSRGEVRITAKLVGDHLRCEVHDTGVGIAREALGRIFDAFGQADDSTSRRFGGTGLGLTISRQLVTLMGGQLEVESQVGMGSVFWLQIPVGPARQSMVTLPPPGAVTRRRPSRPRILVAEDNPVNQRVVKAMLAQLDCDVSLVPNGLLAVEAATAQTWDLVLMDCHMPELDGLEATRAIRAAGFESLPIVALTASALDDERAACLAAGMNDFLAKPLRRAPLEAILGRWSGDTP